MSATPGPWHWERVKPGCEMPEGVADSGALTLLSESGECVVSGAGGEGAGGAWWDVEVSDPDARLIAAAPDLLAALRIITDAHEELEREWHDEFAPTASEFPVNEVVTRARAAIRKATEA